MSSLIQIRNVLVERDRTTILHDFSWRVEPGEHWVVFGPNGAGKTTLLNLILGYLWPTAGSIEVLGELYGQTDLRELRRSVGVVSDHVRSLINPHLTGFETILTGPRAHLNLFEDPAAEELKRAREIIETTRLPKSLLNRSYSVLSTGERQRVLIARALMLQPRILILDEPCAGLDLAGRELVLQTIHRIAAVPNAPSILLTTHHVEEITPDFTHALLLKGGAIQAASLLEEVFTADNLTALFGMPIRLSRHFGRYSAMAEPGEESAGVLKWRAPGP